MELREKLKIERKNLGKQNSDHCYVVHSENLL